MHIALSVFKDGLRTGTRVITITYAGDIMLITSLFRDLAHLSERRCGHMGRS